MAPAFHFVDVAPLIIGLTSFRPPANNWRRFSASRKYGEMGPKTGPQAKVQNGAIHLARGGAARWSRGGGDTRQPAGREELRLKATRRSASDSTFERRRKGASCSESGRTPVADCNRPHPSECTLFFQLLGLTIGADHGNTATTDGASCGEAQQPWFPRVVR